MKIIQISFKINKNYNFCNINLREMHVFRYKKKTGEGADHNLHWQPSSSCRRWYKITACSRLYRKPDSFVRSEPGNHNMSTWAMWNSAKWDCGQASERERARTRPIGPEPFLPLFLSRFKSKIRNWIEKRKQTERKVCEKYGISQLCPERPTDRFVQIISKLDRKHCRMLVELLTKVYILTTLPKYAWLV